MGNQPQSVGGPQADFPRRRRGGSSQHLLVTLLGEFWRLTELWLPARAIVRLAGDVDLSQSAATTALSRLSSRGVLENGGGGRASQYRFTAEARARLEVGFALTSVFGDPGLKWDGRWTAVAFSIPESERDVREAFKARLRWLGFVPAYGALWFSPRDQLAPVQAIADSYGLDDFMAFHVEDAGFGRRRPSVSDSPDLPRRYTEFAELNEARLQRVLAGHAAPAEALRIRVEAMDVWRSFRWDDPGLPYELLPQDWPLLRARRAFVEVYRATAPGAAKHIDDTLRELAPKAAGGAVLPDLSPSAALHSTAPSSENP